MGKANKENPGVATAGIMRGLSLLPGVCPVRAALNLILCQD